MRCDWSCERCCVEREVSGFHLIEIVGLKENESGLERCAAVFWYKRRGLYLCVQCKCEGRRERTVSVSVVASIQGWQALLWYEMSVYKAMGTAWDCMRWYRDRVVWGCDWMNTVSEKDSNTGVRVCCFLLWCKNMAIWRKGGLSEKAIGGK